MRVSDTYSHQFLNRNLTLENKDAGTLDPVGKPAVGCSKPY